MHPIISNSTVVDLTAKEHLDIYQWMDAGVSRMSTDKTKYHTVQHVETMLQVLDAEYKNPDNRKFFQDELTVEDLAKVLVATCWHDVVYIPGDQYNEQKSAAEWEQYAKNIGNIPSNFIRVVFDMINSTKIGFDVTWIQDHPTVALLHDLDYISFASYAVMVMNRDLLRNEFDFLDVSKYIEGRLKFLKMLMDTTASSGLFLTPVFSKYNELATENILREYQHYKRKVYRPTDPRDREASSSNYTDQQHEDITLDFFMRLTMILNDWEPEDRLKAFNNIKLLILERINTEGELLHDYSSVERVINIIQNAPEEERDKVIMKQIAAAIERVETYRSLMDTKDDEYIITGEEDESDC